MSPRLPLEELGATPRERRLLARVGVVVSALMIGAGVGVSAYVWADSRISGAEVGLSAHLQEMKALRPRMDEYVREERAARCSMARNIYALCRQTAIVCEPVSASCTHLRDE